MPVLANARHEKFAVGIANGMSATEAYRQAGFGRPTKQSASRLMTHVDVQARIMELKQNLTQQAMLRSGLSKEWVINELMATYKHAREIEQVSAAVGALKLLGAEAGLFTERSSNQNEDVTKHEEIIERLKGDLELAHAG